MLHCLVCEWDVHGKRACDERKVFIVLRVLEWESAGDFGEAGGGGSARSRRRRKNNRCKARDRKNIQTVECVFGWNVNVGDADSRYRMI